MFTRKELSDHYDSLQNKDMPREQFIAEVQELFDPKLMKQDAATLAMDTMQGKRKKSPIITL